MDKAFECHTGDKGSNPDKAKEDFFFLEKIQIVSLSPQVPHHVLSLSSNGSFLQELRVNLLLGRINRE